MRRVDAVREVRNETLSAIGSKQWSSGAFSRACPLSADLALPDRLPGKGMIRVTRKLNSTGVIDTLTDLFILCGPEAYVRTDNGPGFVAQAVRDWITAVGARTAFIDGQKKPYNTNRPHSALGYDPQAPETIVP